MRIALAHKRLDLRGGTERVLYRTAEGLRDRGYEVHLFCGEFSIPPPRGTFGHSLPYVRWPRTARLLTFALLAPRVIAKHRCDLVISFDRMIRQDLFRSGGGPHRVFLQKMSRRRNLWRRLWYGLSPYHRCLLAVERRQMSDRGSRKIIAVCEQGKREIMEAYGVPEERVTVVHNGVDLERFHPRRRFEGGKTVREKLEISPESAVVLFVGTGFRRKGLDRLLYLWNIEKFNDTCLVVVGNDSRLSSYQKRWSRKNIIFVGPQAAVEDYYAAADLLVLPSLQEAFGNVALEALASGLPVITVAGVGALDEVDGDLSQAILVDPDDAVELSAKIFFFLDRARWSDWSMAARRAAERYSWDKYFVQLEKIIDEVAGRGR